MAGWSDVQDAYAHLLAGDIDGAKHHLEVALDPERQMVARAHSRAVAAVMEQRAKDAAKKAEASKTAEAA